MRSRYIGLILLCLVVLPAAGEDSVQANGAQAVPAWLENINPADYALIASDLKEPFIFNVDYGIQAFANSTGMRVTTAAGSADQTQVSYLDIMQDIDVNIEPRNEGHSLFLNVMVFATPELAIESAKNMFEGYGFTEDHLNSGFVPGYNGLKDPRLEGVGASSWGGNIIHYKNIVARIYEHGSFKDASLYIKPLAKLWIDKVSKIKPQKVPDLRLQPGGIYLTYGAENNFLPTEIAADKQALAVQIDNAGTEDAKGVKLQMYLQKGDRYDPLGDPVEVGDMPAGSNKTVSTFWDLEGKNVQDAVLMAQAFIPGQDDANQDDNTAAVTASIYYANNGDRTYSWVDDSYRFVNYGFKGREAEEVVEGLLATIVGNINDKSSSLPLMQRLLFPQTYTRFWNYFGESMRKSGGHCYGMSATSALYFEDPATRPVSKKTSQMTQEEASPNIALYHRAQMLPVVKAMLTGDNYVSRDESPAKCHQAIKDSLSGERKPVIIEFFGKINNNSVGHAVLAYKLIEVEGRDPVAYVYDPNFPESKARPPKPMPQIVLMLSKGNWANPDYMGYDWAYPDRISAHSIYREIPLQDVNALVPSFKKALYDMMETLRKANAIMAVLRCPADVVFTDGQGHRTGTLNGQAINEIPGAEVLSSGEVEIYYLPREGEYQVSISGTDSGEMGFDIIKPENETGLGLVSFQNVSLQSGARISAKIGTGGEIKSLLSSGMTIEPSLSGSIDLGTGESSAQGDSLKNEPGKSSAGTASTDEVGKYIRDLKDENGTIRWAAVKALGELGDARAVDPLIEVLKGDSYSGIRESAAISLGMIKDERALIPLLEALQGEDEHARSGAANGLGWLRDPRSVDALCQALQDEFYEVRGLAAMSLGFIKDPSSIDPLIDALQDDRSEVRGNAAWALGEIRDKKAIDPLVSALQDENEDVRAAAKGALQNLGWDEGSAKMPGASNGNGEISTGSGSKIEHVSIFSAQKIDDRKGDIVSPDGTRIAYSAGTDGGKHYVIAGPDGKIEEGTYQDVNNFVFSSDGRHYAYKALVGDKRLAVVDGSEGQKYDEIYKIVFSLNGERYAYVADKGGQRVVVVDGNEEGPYESTDGDPVISSHGQHVLYTISRDHTNYVVVDGKVQENIGWNPVVSPDGSRWAYSRSASYTGDPCYIVLDGEINDLGKDNRIGQMVFSPDGRHFIYDLIPGAGAYGDHIVVVDGARVKAHPFPGVGKIVFSPDSSNVDYSAKASGAGFFMVLDGEEDKIYDEVSDPVFSPDGDQDAYVAKDKDGKFVVKDGVEGPKYVDAWGLNFSVDGDLAYVARDNREGIDVRLAVVGYREEKPYRYDWYGQGIRSGPIFSPDGSHVAYIANDGGEAEYVVIDGTEYQHPWSFKGGLSWGEGSPIVFDDSRDFHYIAENESGTYLIRVKIPESSSRQHPAEPAGVTTPIGDQEGADNSSVIASGDSSQPPKDIPPANPSADFSWVGKDSDKVGTWDNGLPDELTDGHFRARLNLPSETEIRSIKVLITDSSGTPMDGGVHGWSSADENYWILGVFEGGQQLNQRHVSSLGTFSGDVELDLYCTEATHLPEWGRFGPGSHFLIEVELGDGSTLRKETAI